MEFEWDAGKARTNEEKHGIAFLEAAEVLLGNIVFQRSDRGSEPRFLATGPLESGALTTVIFTIRGERIRIISARRARQHERRAYREIHG
jgi:uncharacterized protein